MLAKAKLGSKIIKTNLGFPSPYQLNFAVTYLCNSRCKFCQIWKHKPKNELTLGEIREFTKKIPHMQWVRLTGGEPFIRKDFVDIVRVFHKNLPDMYLLTTTTNSSMPAKVLDDVKRILGFFGKKFVISISLDGNKKMHERLRGIKGSWDNAVRLYKDLKKLEPDHKNFSVFFGYTIYPDNVGKFGNAFNSVKKEIPDITVNDFHVNVFETSDMYFRNEKTRVAKNFPAEASREIKKIMQMRKKGSLIDSIESKYLRLAVKYLENRRTPIKCNILDLSFFVDPQGNVFPCMIFGAKIGSLRENNYDLKKILGSSQAKLVKKRISEYKCPGCWTPCEAHQLIVSNWMKTT